MERTNVDIKKSKKGDNNNKVNPDIDKVPKVYWKK